MTVYVGVDPGLRSGAVAAIDHNGKVITYCDIPQIDDRIDVVVFRHIVQEALGVTSDKNTSLALARGLFPEAVLDLKKHHGKAEALLIAEYARRLG